MDQSMAVKLGVKSRPHLQLIRIQDFGFEFLDTGFPDSCPSNATESILHTANTYLMKGLMSINELDVKFARLVAHQAPQVWWKDCENIRFISRVFLARQMFAKAEPYLITILEIACQHIGPNGQSDFFEQDQYACFMFETLSNHVSAGNPNYELLVAMLEQGLRDRKHPSQFDCLELTCWIMLATTYANFAFFLFRLSCFFVFSFALLAVAASGLLMPCINLAVLRSRRFSRIACLMRECTAAYLVAPSCAWRSS